MSTGIDKQSKWRPTNPVSRHSFSYMILVYFTQIIKLILTEVAIISANFA